MLGKKDVQEAKGTHIVREAIHTIRFHLQVKRGETGHSGAKLQKVDTGPYAGWGRSIALPEISDERSFPKGSPLITIFGENLGRYFKIIHPLALTKMRNYSTVGVKNIKYFVPPPQRMQ